MKISNLQIFSKALTEHSVKQMHANGKLTSVYPSSSTFWWFHPVQKKVVSQLIVAVVFFFIISLLYWSGIIQQNRELGFSKAIAIVMIIMAFWILLSLLIAYLPSIPKAEKGGIILVVLVMVIIILMTKTKKTSQ